MIRPVAMNRRPIVLDSGQGKGQSPTTNVGAAVGLKLDKRNLKRQGLMTGWE